MQSKGPRAAVVDIGSNTIKVLVVERAPDGTLHALHFRTIDARLGTGFGKSEGLSAEGVSRALDAIEELVLSTNSFQPNFISLVATSAVRDASNGADFARRVLSRTGHPVRILSGEEEAHLIGRGLCCDPALTNATDFYVFDLGGGSLECLSYRNRRREQGVSLLLGCVRLTELFVPSPSAPIPETSIEAVKRHTRETITANGFRFDLPPTAVAIGTGGTLTAARSIGGARIGESLESTPTWIPFEQLRELKRTTSRVPLEDRKRLPGMPASRADVLPVALATLVAVAEMGGLSGYRHSLYSLRWGVAAELLDAAPSSLS